MEEPFSILSMQDLCNNIYDNDHKIIDWGPNKGKNNLVTSDASDVGTEGGRMTEGEENMVQGKYLNITSRL